MATQAQILAHVSRWNISTSGGEYTMTDKRTGFTLWGIGGFNEAFKRAHDIAVMTLH